MNKLLMTTALVMLTAGPISAQTAATTAEPIAGVISYSYGVGDMQVGVEDMLGKEVYIKRSDMPHDSMDLTMGMDDAPDGWESVGEIGDVMVSSEGEVNSVVVDSGGFLGMGERNSRISMDQMQFVRDTNDEGEYFVVFTGDRAALEGVDVYDADRMRADGYQSTLDMRMANNQLAYTNARDNRETWASVDWSTMTTEDLTGVQVNGSNDNWVGEISELVLGDDGKTITHAVIDVGGWLGIGERPVAMTFEQIDLRRNADNDSVIAYVDATEEELENMPEWER